MDAFLDDPNKMKKFKYTRGDMERPKKIIWVTRTEHLFGTIQVLKKGGETNLHSHPHLDGFWFVLNGHARFYSDETTVHCELTKHEGVLIPRGVAYWFEAVGDETLEMVQVEASSIPIRNRDELNADRIDYSERVRTPSSVA